MHLVNLVFKRRKWDTSSSKQENVVCFKITNVKVWDVDLVKLYNYISLNVFFSVLMSRECLKWTYNIKHPSERNAKIASNWN